MLGIQQLSKQQLTQKLRKAVQNSLRKKYHGEDQQVNVLPTPQQTIKQYKKKYQTFKDFYNPETKTLRDSNDQQWFKALVNRFEWIKNLVEAGQKLYPSRIAEINDQIKLSPNGLSSSSKDFQSIKQTYMLGQSQNILERSSSVTTYPQQITWRDVFLKLDLQDFLLTQFVYNPDFKKLYEYLEVCKPHISFLLLPITPKTHIKSGYYWIMVLLSKLTSLRCLYIYTPNPNNYLNADGIKYLAKGFSNFKSAGGRLQKLVIEKTILGLNSVCEEKFNEITRLLCDDLKVLIMRNSPITKGLATSISKLLSEGRGIVQLELRKCNLTITQGKEIADGLMRAKNLEIIKLRQNPSIDYGINYILYNLAFSPRIAHIDISQVRVSQRIDETAQAIYKLVKISGSLQTLVLNQTQIMHHLTRDFWRVLGQNATLKHLYIDTLESKYLKNLKDVGRFIAFNAYKKGSLELLSIKNAIINHQHLQDFINCMILSKAAHQKQYGDSSVADKMKGDELRTYFYCHLKYLFVSNGDFRSYFDLATYKRQINLTKIRPRLMLLMAAGCLQYFEYSKGRLNKADADLLGLCLSNEKCTVKSLNLGQNDLGKEGTKIFARQFYNSKSVQALDLSSNKIGVQGAKAMAKMLEVNSQLRYLNLYCNNVDVDGARSLNQTLRVNCSLECLDIGLNRIRKKGLMALSDGLFNNQNGSKLKILGLKLNFLDDDSCQCFVDKFLQAKQKSELKKIFVKKNYLSERGLNKIKQKLYDNENINEESDDHKDAEGEEVKKATLSIDAMDKMKQLEAEKLQRTVWVSPLQSRHSEAAIKNFFEDENCGIVLNVRIRQGPLIPGKPSLKNRFAFVQFAHPTSVLRALRVASKRKSIIDGSRIRIYKAGSKTYSVVRPKKSKNLSIAKSRTFKSKPTVNLGRCWGRE